MGEIKANTIRENILDHKQFTNNCRKIKRNRTVGFLITDEIENALLIWIKRN